jgi:hypothetical protein
MLYNALKTRNPLCLLVLEELNSGREVPKMRKDFDSRANDHFKVVSFDLRSFDRRAYFI